MWERKVELIESDGSSKYLKTYNSQHKPSHDSLLREKSVYSQLDGEYSPRTEILEDSLLMENLANTGEMVDPKLLAKSLKHLHSLQGIAPLDALPLCFGSYQDYMRYNLDKISELKNVYSDDENKSFMNIAKYMDEVRLQGEPVVLHGDFAFGNFATAGETIKLFDFECSHLGQPEFDIAGALSLRIFSSRAEFESFLEEYFSGSTGKTVLAPYIVFDWIRRYRADLVRKRDTILRERIAGLFNLIEPQQLFNSQSISEIGQIFEVRKYE